MVFMCRFVNPPAPAVNADPSGAGALRCAAGGIREIECDDPRRVAGVAATDCVAIDAHSVVACLEQVTDAPVAPIDVLGIIPIELAHHPGEVGLQCRRQRMVMVVHQDIRVHEFPIPFDRLGQPQKEVLAVAVVAVEGFALVAARRQVIDRARKLDS